MRTGPLLLVFSLCWTVAAAGVAAPPGAEAHAPALQKRLAAALAAGGADYVPRTQHPDADGAPRYVNRLILGDPQVRGPAREGGSLEHQIYSTRGDP